MLAVIWSKDLGEKKTELVDNYSQMLLDEQFLKSVTDLERKGLTSYANVLQAERNVRADQFAVAKAERTLEVWQVSRDEIDALKKDARASVDKGQKRDPKRERLWARVEVFAPIGGTVVEKNIVVGQLVDPTKDLFKLAVENQLAVRVHVYQESLPDLLSLKPAQRKWTVRLRADPGVQLPEGTITTIGSIIDPNTNTALVMGTVPNPVNPANPGERRMIAGEFVTATIQMPANPDEAAVPASAVVEDGEESVLFVQPDANRRRYELWRVQVVRRTNETLYIRWPRRAPLVSLMGASLTGSLGGSLGAGLFGAAANERPNPLTDPLDPSEVRVVSSGSLQMLNALQDLQGSK
jgi:cobalt-zinc-cadmium efflux system membrane fusion protein